MHVCSEHSLELTSFYRMGKDDKYDVKLAHPEDHCAGHEEGHTCLERIPNSLYLPPKADPRNNFVFPLVILKRACNKAIKAS